MFFNNGDNNNNNNQQELEFNKKHREDYEQLMKDSSTQLDGYWDKNNIFVRLILFVLAFIIVAGVAYYVMAYLGSR